VRQRAVPSRRPMYCPIRLHLQVFSADTLAVQTLHVVHIM